MPRQSGVPSTTPTSTPPAPPPQPSGTPGTNNPGQSPPPDPKPVGTPNPPPPPVGAPPKTGPQQRAPEQEAGDEENDVESGDASTEPDAAKLEEIYARLMGDVDQRVSVHMEHAEAKILGIYDQIGSVAANVAGLKSSMQAVNQNMADMKEVVKALHARSERIDSELKLVEGRIPNPIRLKEEILSDFRQLLLSQAQAAATTAAPGPVTPAPLVGSPTSAPSPVTPANETSRSSLTLEDLKTLISGAVRSAMPAPAPAPGQPVPDVLNQPASDGERTGTQILMDNLNPFLGLKDLSVGLLGMFTTPFDAADSIGKLEAGGMSVKQRGDAASAAQMTLRGATTVAPWLTGSAAAYAAYTGTAAPTVLGTVGGTTMLTVSSGSLLAAAGAGAVSFAMTAGLLAIWRAYRLNNVAVLREQNYQREVLLAKHNQDLINAIKGQSAVSQPRTT